jgi:hypothetical protein
VLATLSPDVVVDQVVGNTTSGTFWVLGDQDEQALMKIHSAVVNAPTKVERRLGPGDLNSCEVIIVLSTVRSLLVPIVQASHVFSAVLR